MELLYIWIEDFRNIRQQGFNFSSELMFTMILSSSKEVTQTYSLHLEYNNNYVNLFDGAVTNAIGIVGKNGSGKSSLLHCLKMLCGQLQRLTSPLIFALLDRESNTVSTYYYEGGGVESMKILSVKLEVRDNVRSRFKVLNPEGYKISRWLANNSKVSGLKNEFQEISCCYFSSAFDSHRENIYEGITNVSTNYRIEAFLKRYIEEKEKAFAKEQEKNKIPKIELFPSHIAEYHKSELKTLTKFLSYAVTRKTGALPTLPNALIVEFRFDDYEFLISEAPSSFLYDKNVLIKIQEYAVREVTKSTNKRANFLNIVVLCSFYYALKQQLLNPDNFQMDRIRDEIATLASDSASLFPRLRSILGPLSSGEKESKEKETIRQFLGNEFGAAVEKIQFSDTDVPSDNKVHFRLKINSNLWVVLSLIHDLKALEESSFIDYSWGGGLSTGEEAFLIHFARLYEAKSKLTSKTIWLLVDEGDLYFHPQWQKEYFSHLVEYIQFIFPRKKVQIIISTHSPFIASDLPKQNLIFLTKSEDGSCLVVDNKQQPETFGSNIHELFTSTFFLSNGLMGDFSRIKIEQLIKEINSAAFISDRDFEEKYRSRIAIVGEPFIRAKLYEMVATKSEVTVIDEIIGQRNNEIEWLRDIKKRKQNDQNRKS